MKIVNKEVIKPISLHGCYQILDSLNIDYSTWDIRKIFIEAEKIAQEQNIKCNEVFIEII